MKRTIAWLPALSLLVIACNPTLAGLGTTTGREWLQWTQSGYCVVVGRLDDARHHDADVAGKYRATFAPLASFAGTFDPGAFPAIPVIFYGGKNSSIRDVPAHGSMVLAVMQFRLPEGDEKPSGFIVSDICTFMPGESSLVRIDGLNDPRVLDTVKKLRDARAHPDPDPYRAATQPAVPTTRSAEALDPHRPPLAEATVPSIAEPPPRATASSSTPATSERSPTRPATAAAALRSKLGPASRPGVTNGSPDLYAGWFGKHRDWFLRSYAESAKKRDARVAAFSDLLRDLPHGVRAECLLLDTYVQGRVRFRGEPDYSTAMFYHLSCAVPGLDDRLRALGAIALADDQWSFVRPHVSSVFTLPFNPLPPGSHHLDVMVMCHHDGTRWTRGEWTELLRQRDEDDDRTAGARKVFYIVDALWWFFGRESGIDSALPLLEQAVDDFKAWQHRRARDKR